jgi:hypothetical protein
MSLPLFSAVSRIIRQQLIQQLMSLELNADTEDSAHTDTENDEELEELEELEGALTSEDWYPWPDKSALDRVYEFGAVDDSDIYNSGEDVPALAEETPEGKIGEIDFCLPVNPIDDCMNCPTQNNREAVISHQVSHSLKEKTASLTQTFAQL